MFKRFAIGFLTGVVANQVVALAVSYALKLGYYMPCIASLPERVGGELNAVLLQMLVCGMLGASAGIAWHSCKQKQWTLARRAVVAVSGAVLSNLLAVMVAVIMIR